MIKCKNICKSFDKKTVLDGIDIDISEGQIFGLLGPSGAGKTTLIKILTGQLAFENGSVEIFGKDVSSLNDDDHRHIGIMMDSFGVYERLSCADNLKMYADIYGVPHTRVREILETVGLGDSYKKAASNLSKGMLSRLQLARAFIHSPKLIFLDEPTSGLDPASAKAIRRIIMEKKNEGCTVFLTTHNMEEATELCDIVVLLNEGKIVERGEPGELCRRYNHQRKIVMLLNNGEEVSFPHDVASAGQIAEIIAQGKMETIHSSEPNLETVFLELTGRKFEESK